MPKKRVAAQPIGVAPGDLQAIEDAPTAVDSTIAVIDWLVANQTISAEVGGVVKLGLEARREQLEPAIQANVHN